MNQPPLNPDALAEAIDTIGRLNVASVEPAIVGRLAIETYLAVAQPVVRGYIIVDKKSNAIDWDGELHPSIESAIESMTGPHQSMCRTAEEEDDTANDGRTAWWRIYSIHTVTDRPAVES